MLLIGILIAAFKYNPPNIAVDIIYKMKIDYLSYRT